MTSEIKIEQWVNDIFKSIDTKDTELFSNFLSDDVHFRFGNMPHTLGKSAVTDQVSYFFDSIKSLKHQITEFWSHNDSIICHGSVCYTRHDNSTLDIPFSNILKLHKDKIREYLIFVDVSELYERQ